MATRIEKDSIPKNKKTQGLLLRAAEVVLGGSAVAGGIIGGIKIAKVGPFENSSPSQENHRELIGGIPSQTEIATQIAKSPTPEPTISTGYHENPSGISYTTETGETLNVPQINGLKSILQAENGIEKVIYIANPDNPYGMAPEQYAGEYKPNVLVEQKQTGGVVLKAPVVLKLTDDKLAKIPEQKDKWIIPLPVDIRKLNSSENILIGFEKNRSDPSMLAKIEFNGITSVVNIIPNDRQLRVGRTIYPSYYGWIYLDAMRLLEPYTQRVYPGKEENYISVMAQLQGFSTNATIKSSFGNKIAEASGPVFVEHAAGSEGDNITPYKILTVGQTQSPVFLAANTP